MLSHWYLLYGYICPSFKITTFLITNVFYSGYPDNMINFRNEKLSGSVLDLRSRGCGFEPHLGAALCTLARRFILCLVLEDPSQDDWKVVGWDVKNPNKQITLKNAFAPVSYFVHFQWFVYHHKLYDRLVDCHLLIAFANCFYPDQAWHFVRPGLDPNCLTLWWYSWKIFWKKLILKKISRRQNFLKNSQHAMS